MPADNRSLVACRVCGHANPGERRYCQHCWSSLAGAGAITAAEAAAQATARRRRSTRHRLIYASIFAILATGAALAFYTSNRPAQPLEAATTSVSSESPAGSWTMVSHDLRNTRYAPAIPRFSGQLKWTFGTGEGFIASPAATADTVYIATGDRRVVALDAETGQVRWQSATQGPISSSPAISEGVLYVGLRDGQMVALDAKSGQQLWSFDAGTPITASPVVASGYVYIGDGNGVLRALDAKTGAVRWHTTVGGWIDRVPALSDRYLVLAVGGEVHVYDRETGAPRVLLYVSGGAATDPIVIDNRLYIGSSRGVLLVMDLDWRPPFIYRNYTVRKLWSWLWLWNMAPLPPSALLALENYRLGPPTEIALADDVLYISLASGKVMATDLETQEPMWTYSGAAGANSSLIVAGDVAYIGTSNGMFNAVDRQTGTALWAYPAQIAVRTTPVVNTTGIYIAGANGTLYALR
ncbi:MAG: hypothetical protein EXR43_00805 [Dehalococcoidia bacterium]|nr:hypothetical protein [Dehalococcoidia bacterium]